MADPDGAQRLDGRGGAYRMVRVAAFYAQCPAARPRSRGPCGRRPLCAFGTLLHHRRLQHLYRQSGLHSCLQLHVCRASLMVVPPFPRYNRFFSIFMTIFRTVFCISVESVTSFS